MRIGDRLGDSEMSKKGGSLFVQFKVLTITTDKNGFRRIKEEGQIYKILLQTF